MSDCADCNQKIERIQTRWQRQLAWNRDAMPILSDVASVVYASDHNLGEQLASLIADLNAIGVEDKKGSLLQ